MAYQISDDCISCGVCASNCPVGAISEGDGKFVIDADTCIDCGACAENCPVGAPAQAESIRTCGRIRPGRMRLFLHMQEMRKFEILYKFR